MPTKAQLAQDLAVEAGEQYDDIDIKEQFEEWVQWAVDEVYAGSPWFFRNASGDITTANGTKVYTLGSTVAQVRDMVVTGVPAGQESIDGRHIVYAPVERLIAHGNDLDEAGAPKYWYFAGVDSSTALKVAFQPVPNGIFTVTVHELQRPADLGSDDSIPLPKEYLTAVRDKVRFFLAMSDGRVQDAGVFQQGFAALMQQLAAQYSGLSRGPSRLRIKGVKAEYQSPSTPGGG